MGRVISAYTPSNTPPDVLKRIFVQRHRLLDKLVERLARSMTSSDKHHILLVGPRGSGKTHMVTLVEHALRERAELADTMRVAWLGEDATIASLVDLAFAIADQLARAYPEEFPADHREAVRGLAPDDAAESTLATLVDRCGARSILLITENMDRAFRGLGDLGRKKWRAFLQERRRVAILATSQQLFSGVSSRSEVFFGFFDIHHLKALSVDEAHTLMSNIAAEQGHEDLLDFLRTPTGRYRVRALHHLAGGNHRLYVLLSEFLTRESLSDLVAAFEDLADDLTPYFQSRVRSLAPQQARILESLCAATGAMTVKEVSRDTFIPERNCSKQLGLLKQKGYVRAQRDGKESFYEVAEPLMRLCIEAKQQRGLPLGLVAQFLRAWFSDEELRQGIGPEGPRSKLDRYRARALHAEPSFEGPIEMPDAPPEERARALNARAAASWHAQRYLECQRDLETALSVVGASPATRTRALFALPEPMVVTSSHRQTAEALRLAFEEGDRASEGYGGTPADLLAMVLRRGHAEWRKYVTELAPLYIDNGAAEGLGEGLTRTIAVLDAGGYSGQQLDEWSSAWQAAGADCDALIVPLLSLGVAIDVIKTRTERPLLRLPSEIRTLIRPLLSSSLGDGS